MKSKILVIVFYLCITLFIFRGILITPGKISGGDWSLPETSEQGDVFASMGMFKWHYTVSLFGSQTVTSNDYWFSIFTGILPLNWLGGAFEKVLLIFLFTLAGFSIHSYCRFLKLRVEPSILGGFFFITSPLFFNYTIIGWIHVLLSMGLLPFALITFTKSIKEQKVSYAIITGLLYSAAMLQSQTLIWYPLAFILLSFFIISSKEQVKLCIKSFAIIFTIFFLIHSSWLIPTMLLPDQVVSQTVSQFDINRFALRLNYINLLRLWGSLFNYQYESSVSPTLLFLTLLPPFLAYLALIVRKKDRMVLFFTVLSLLPPILFMGRELFQYVPFSNVIRDSSRFMTLSALSYSVLIAMSIDVLLIKGDKTTPINIYKNLLAYTLLFFILLSSSYPFLVGGLYGDSKYGYDIRLRALEYPNEYYEINHLLAKEESSSKALYLPLGDRLDLEYNKKFHGSYTEITDVFARYSTTPGIIALTDRGIGIPTSFVQFLLLSLNSDRSFSLVSLLSLANIKYVVIRLNTNERPGDLSMEKSSHKLEVLEGFRKIYNNSFIAAFENSRVLPRIYPAKTSLFDINKKIINVTVYKGGEKSFNWKYLADNSFEARFYEGSKNVIISDGKESEDTLNSSSNWNAYNSTLIYIKAGSEPLIIDKIIEHGNTIGDVVGVWTDIGPVSNINPILITSNNKAIIQINHTLDNVTFVLLTYDYHFDAIKFEKPPAITFQQINPTKYKVRVDNATQPFFLVFSESYDPQWKVYVESMPFRFNEIVAEYDNTGVKEAKKEMRFTPTDISYLFKKPLSDDMHRLVNGYANAWYINPEEVGKENFTVTIYFKPQSYYYLGFIIAGLTLLGCLIYLIYNGSNKIHSKISNNK